MYIHIILYLYNTANTMIQVVALFRPTQLSAKGNPQSPWRSIRNHGLMSLMTWMIWGYPHDLGNPIYPNGWYFATICS